MPSDPQRVQAIFIDAVQKSESERAEFLERECGGDSELRRRVDALIAAHDQSGSFLDSPPKDLAGTSPTIAHSTPEQAGSLIGPYKLLQQIGEGGMGSVYMAEQIEPVERRVALKIIKPGMDTKTVIARFEAERQAIAMMDHPNIAKVLDVGMTKSGRPYFVMELVRGVPITQYCDEHQLTPRQRLELFLPVCQAVQHAHQKGIIHRDIKPSNVLVAEYDDQPVPKIIDFGLAKAMEKRLTAKTMFTEFGQVVGTPDYMSPEQAKLNEMDIDTRSDIYSLGVLLYELLSGSTPFDCQRLRSAAFDELLRIIREEEPPKPSQRLSTVETLPSIAANRHITPAELTRQLSGELDWIVMKTLEKDRSRRYETANGLAADLRRYLNDDPVLACPPSAAYRFRKFARRNNRRLAATAVLAIALLVAVGSIAGSIGWIASDRASRQSKLTDQVDLILDDVVRLEKQQDWPAALAAAKRAETALASGEADAAMLRRVRSVLDDLELVRRLEEARSYESLVAEGKTNAAGADLAYTQAFDDAGLTVEILTVEKAAAQLQGRTGIVIELATALTDWARLRRKINNDTDDKSWQHLLAIADAIDPDPWRRKLRAAWKTKDGEANQVRDLARSADVRSLPPSSIRMLGDLVADRVSKDDAADLMRKAQQQNPGDFWINYRLASFLSNSRPKRLDEAFIFYHVALGIRPGHPYVLNSLGVVRADQGMSDEAIAFYKRAIKLNPKYAGTHYNLGTQLGRNGKRDKALAQHEKAIELDPELALPHASIGLQLVKQGKLDEALVSYRTAIKLDPKCAWAYTNMGSALVKQGNLEAGIDAHKKAIELDPECASAYTNMGVTLVKQGNLEAGIAAHKKAIELDPSHHIGLGTTFANQGKLDDAILHYKKALEFNPQDAIAHSNLGATLYRQGKLDEAISYLEKAIEVDPEYALAHNKLGTVHCKQGNLDEALAWYQKAIRLDPKQAQFHDNIGLTLSKQGLLDDAISYHKKAIELDPEYASAHDHLGRLHNEQGNLEEAIACFQKAIELDPKEAKFHNNISAPLSIQGKLDEAISYLEKAIELDPEYAGAYDNLGVMHYKKGNLDEAVAWYQKAIELDPKQVDLHDHIGLALSKQGKLDEAISYYKKAIELDPEHASAHDDLGIALSNQGKLDEAIECYRTAIEVDPKHAPAHNNLGNALKAQGKPDEAIACYRTAIEVDPKNAPAHNNLGNALKAQGKPDEAIECYRTTIELDPKLGPAHNNLGTALSDQGKLDEAIECYRTAIELDPKYAPAHNNLGYALRQQGKLDAAIECFRMAIEVDPKLAMPYKNLGNLLNKTGKKREAINAFREASRLQPDDASVLNNVAWQLARNSDSDLRDPEEAFRLASRAVELSPKEWNYLDTLAVAAHACENWEESLRARREMITLKPARAVDLLCMAIAHAQLGDLEQAKEQYVQAAGIAKSKDDPRFRTEAEELLGLTASDRDELLATYYSEPPPAVATVEYWRGRALWHGAKGNYEQSVADWTHAIQLADQDRESYRQRARAYIALKRWNEAAADFTKAAELKPDLFYLHYWGAVTQLGAGDSEGYRNSCATMLGQFADTEDALIGSITSWSCALAPDAVDDYSLAIDLAERAVKSDSSSAMYASVLGGILYRAGKYEQSLVHQLQAVDLGNVAPEAELIGEPAIWFALAMTHHKLGHDVDARQLLTKAIAQTNEILDQESEAYKSLPWSDRFWFEALRDEATRLIDRPLEAQPRVGVTTGANGEDSVPATAPSSEVGQQP